MALLKVPQLSRNMPKTPSSRKRWKPKYVIVCDEVRFENNGKEIILGVYSDGVIVPSVPISLKVMTFRIVVDVDGRAFETVSFELRGTEGNVGAHISGDAPATLVGQKEGKFLFELPGITLQSEGTKTIWFSLDSNLEQVGEFDVRVGNVGFPPMN